MIVFLFLWLEHCLVVLQAAENSPDTKTRSIVCANCDGNGNGQVLILEYCLLTPKFCRIVQD